MINDVHGMNAHMLISIWSSFGPMTKPYRELDKKGMLFNFSTWPQSGLETWPPDMEYPSGVRVYDAYRYRTSVFMFTGEDIKLEISLASIFSSDRIF